jgi:flagellar biogenesis protein FliO
MRTLPILLAALCGWLCAPILRSVGIVFLPTPLASAIGLILLTCWIVTRIVGPRQRRPRGRR